MNRGPGLLLITAFAILFLATADRLADSTSPLLFGSYWASGRAVLHRQNPYAAYPATFRYAIDAAGTRTEADLNLNPPWLLPLFAFGAHLSLRSFMLAWTGASALLLIYAFAVLLRAYPGMQQRQRLFVAFCAPTLFTLVMGQVYLLPYALIATAIALHKKHRDAAALLLGIVIAMRPTLLLWPFLLLLARHRRMALLMLTAAAALNALPLLTYGPGIYRLWWHAAQTDQHGFAFSNIALPALLGRMHAHWLGLVLSAALLALLSAWAVRRQPEENECAVAGIFGAILCAPLGWIAYALFAVPYLVSRPWNRAQTAAAAILMIPETFFVYAGALRFSAVNLAASLVYITAIGIFSAACFATPYNCTVPEAMLARHAAGRRQEDSQTHS